MSERLKAAFVAQWRWVYKRLNFIVGNLSFKEFIRILDLSVQRRVWEYRDLDVGQLPYVFALLIDFTKVNGFPKRAWYRRFWLLPGEPGHHWVWPEQMSQLCRGDYATPRNGALPAATDLLDFKVIEVQRDFLRDQKPYLHSWIIETVERWLVRHGFPVGPG